MMQDRERRRESYQRSARQLMASGIRPRIEKVMAFFLIALLLPAEAATESQWSCRFQKTPDFPARPPVVSTLFERTTLMPMKHAASQLHHDAAGHHEAAAHHHREAMHHHEKGEHKEAKEHGVSAQEHSEQARA
jgi:hypothetical protein